MTETDKTEKEYEDLVNEIRKRVTTYLEKQVSTMLTSADKELFEMSNSAISNEDQTRYFELMKQLRNIRNILSQNFIKNIVKYLKPYTQVEAEDIDSKNDLDELSLVDQQDMEDMVLIKSISDQTAGAYREKLSHLQLRFEDLALKTTEIFVKDALAPGNICQSFNDSMGIIFDMRSKKDLFKLFQSHTLSALGIMYDDINRLMIENGILPHINLQGGAQSSAPKRAQATAASATPESQPTGAASAAAGHPAGAADSAPAVDLPHIDDLPDFVGDSSIKYAPKPDEGPFGDSSASHVGGSSASHGGSAHEQMNTAPATQSHGGYAMTAAPGMSPYRGAETGGGDRARGGASGSAPQAGSGGAAGGSEQGYQSSYHHQTAGMPASKVDHVLSNYFGSPITHGTPSSTDESTVASQTAGSSQYLGHTEILSALSSVQQQPEFSEPKELKFNSSAIKQAILSAIAKESGGAVTKRINQIAEKTIDFIEMIFDAIIDDEAISDTIKALLLRLQIPVIKASMLDQEFFIYDDHPARVLLDKITETGVGVTERNNEIYITLDKIVHKLVTDYDLQSSSFQTALDELNQYINELEKLARAKEEEEQKHVLKDHARNTVLKTLRSITKGKKLPESIHALVLRRWPTLMFNHYVDFGKENDSWVRIVEILRDIIESIQPLENADDLARLKLVRGELTEAAREYLSRTNQSKKDLDQIIADLVSTYDSMEERANFDEEQIVSAEKALNESGPRGKPPLPEVESPPRQALPVDVSPGMWFKVRAGDDGHDRRCKLSVIVVEDSNLVFVNYAGEIVIEKSFDEFAKELETGQSSVIMGHSVFDHALHTAISGIHAN